MNEPTSFLIFLHKLLKWVKFWRGTSMSRMMSEQGDTIYSLAKYSNLFDSQIEPGMGT